VLGGANSLHTNSLDETLSLPTEEAATIALRTQQIIAHESGVADFIDPFAGAWYVESLTYRMEADARAIIDRIDAMGGMVAAIEEGYPMKEIAEAAFRYQQQVEKGEKVIVGVNRFVAEEEEPIPILKVDEQVEDEQIARLRDFRARRDPTAVKEALERLRLACRGTENTMPHILRAVQDRVSMGDLRRVPRGVGSTETCVFEGSAGASPSRRPGRPTKWTRNESPGSVGKCGLDGPCGANHRPAFGTRASVICGLARRPR
jgi:methylmalonyl-CoA mutase N-terminal domain/subunit